MTRPRLSQSHPLRRVHFICQTLGIDGAEQVNRDMLEALQDRGIKVQAFVTFARFAEMLQEKKIPVHRLPVVLDIIGNWKGLVKAAVLWPFGVAQYLWAVWQSKDADVIVMSGFIEKILVTPLARLWKIPVIWIEFSPLGPVFRKFAGLPEYLYRAVLGLPATVIVPTPYTQRFFIEEVGVEPRRLHILQCARYKLNIEKYLKISPFSNFTVVCVSRMEKGKGQDLLVQAFVEVVKQAPGARLVFAGEGEFETEVRQVVAAYHLEDNVEFRGRVADPLELMARATVCVFPSVWSLEGFGLVTIEAMALAKPIVAFDCGPTPEMVENGKTGLLAEKGNVAELAQKILIILKQPHRAAELGRNAQQVYRSRYRFETIIDEYISVFAKVSNA